MDMLLAGIFTNLSTFTPWILDTMAKDSTKLDKPKATEILTKETEATKSETSTTAKKNGVDNTTSLPASFSSTKAPKYICCFWQKYILLLFAKQIMQPIKEKVKHSLLLKTTAYICKT